MEIEKKYLTREIPFPISRFPFKQIAQAYVSVKPTIRIRQSQEEYYLTVKGKGHVAREEFELPISKKEFDALFEKTEGNPVLKKRYYVPIDHGYTAEVDIYEGALTGLVTTEVEFPTMEEAQRFVAPTWFGREVSEDKRFKNTSLSLYGKPEEL